MMKNPFIQFSFSGRALRDGTPDMKSAPNPPPKESLKPGLPFDFYNHYAEPAWDQRRINNINQHFVTAFSGIQLKNKDYVKYLKTDEDNKLRTWPGFKNRTSVGLELLHLLPVMR